MELCNLNCIICSAEQYNLVDEKGRKELTMSLDRYKPIIG